LDALFQIKEATEKLFKDNKLIEEEKLQSQDGQWTDEKVKVVIKMIIDLTK
jgi:hypothetical protein